MSMVTLACPHCGFSKDLVNTSMPPIGTKVTCPKCRGHFTWLESQAEAPSASTGDLPIRAPKPADSPHPSLSSELPPLDIPRAPIRPQPWTRKKKLIAFVVIPLGILAILRINNR